MHEMGVTRSLVDMVVNRAEGLGATEVKAVYLSIGFVRDVVDTLMDGCFRWMARGTIASNAELVIERIPFTVRCNCCGTVYPLDVRNENTWDCPICHVRNYKVNSGMEFRIDRIEMRFDNEVSLPAGTIALADDHVKPVEFPHADSHSEGIARIEREGRVAV